MLGSHAKLAGAIAACAIGLGAIAPVAQGAVIATIVNLGTPTGNGTTVYTGFTAYVLRLSTTDGGVISAIDFGGTASGTLNGIFGTQISQRAVLSTDPETNVTTRSLTPQLGTKITTSSVSLDSHFLQDSTVRTDAAAPAEDNNGTNLSGQPADNTAADFGTGTKLTATYGIQGASQATTVDLAYIVLPNAATARFNGLASENGLASSLAGNIGPNAAIPEPTSLAAIALGGVSLLRRKRTA